MVKVFEGPVYLEPIEHVYFHRVTGQKYTSVTKILQLVEHEFETEKVAARIVKQSDSTKNPDYIGMNYDEIIDYWQMLNDTANEYGTFVHETVEKYLLADNWYFPKDELEKKVIRAYKKLNVDEGVCIYPERIMFSEKYALAGTADLKIDIDEHFFDIGDWKTNKKFEFFNPFGSQCLKQPVEHLQQCHHSLYSLQLSIYAYMCEEETGMKCRQIWIGYWSRETEEFSRVAVTYLKNEARQLLELHKYNTQIAV
jgi:hypothetical protein